jgi:hypothetical protein
MAQAFHDAGIAYTTLLAELLGFRKSATRL